MMRPTTFATPSRSKHNRRRRIVPVVVNRRAAGSRAIDPIERAAAEAVYTCLFDTLELRQMMAAHVVGSNVDYVTIQSAVDAAAPGATVTVDAGTYNESVVIYKPLKLLGNNAGVDGRGTRKAESVIFNSQTAIVVGASDVTIDGFTIQGTIANVGTRQVADVLMKPSINGTDVLNNVIRDNVTGIYLANNSDTNAAVIQRNYFYNNTETGSDWTYGWNGSRHIYTDGEVSGGCLTNVLIDSNKFYHDDTYVGEGAIALSALSVGKQFNVSITRNSFNSAGGRQSKALIAFNVMNLSFLGNDVTGTNDASSGPVRFEGNVNTVNIQYNSIYNNPGPGVAVDGCGLPGNSSGFVVSNNNITGNTLGLLTIADVYDGAVVATNGW